MVLSLVLLELTGVSALSEEEATSNGPELRGVFCGGKNHNVIEL